MIDTELADCKCKQQMPRAPNLDTDLRVRRFQPSDTRRIHNLFLEETRCLLWPMFVKTIRSPTSIVLHVFLLVSVALLARSCTLALLGMITGVSVIFVYSYKWFYQYLTSSLKGDLANISQYYLSKAKCNFLVAEFGGSVVGFIAVDQKSETVAVLKRISVDTCFRERRKNIATKLLQEAARFCQECGYSEIALEFPDTSKTKQRPRRIDLRRGPLDARRG